MVKKNVLISVAGIVISHCLCPAVATTYYVNPGQSIQAAIDAASYLDTVEVAAGTYPENITLKNGVALVGADAASTIIDPNSGRVIYTEYCDPNTRLDGFTITGAAGSTFGGGIYNYYSNITIKNCAFVGNSANYGGAMRNHYSDPTVINCVFSGNSAIIGAGVSNNKGCCPTFTNCTFSHNFASEDGGAMRNYMCTPTITNCIMFHNTADISGDEISNVSSSPVISHSDIAGCGSSAAWDTSFGTDGGANLDSDPLFVRNPNDGGDGWGDDPCTPGDESANDDYGDLHLDDGSPCIDVGDNSAVIAIPFDHEGNPRISNTVVDMGVYERLCICSLTGDFDCSCGVDLADLAILSKAWQSEDGQALYNPLCDIGTPGDDLIDIEDVKVLAENWLTFASPQPDIAHWTMNEDANNTTVADIVGGNDGTARQNTSVLHTEGRINGALTFNGTTDYIDIGSLAALDDLPADDFTVSAWIYDVSTTGKGIIIGVFPDSTAGWILRKQGIGENLYIDFWAGYSIIDAYFATPAGSLESDNWHHVAAVWDAGTKTCKIYIDGSEPSYVTTTAGNGSYNSDASYDKEMGRMAYTGGLQFFDGKIDDVKIFNRALSDIEVLRLAITF